MSKLKAFLAKTRDKKAAAKPAADAESAVGSAQPQLLSTEKPAAPVTLDVVQTKVLEQWAAGEDEELIEEPVDIVRPTVRTEWENDDEEEEIDLPSNKVRGNFEWKRKAEDLEEAERKAAEVAAAAEAHKLGGVLMRKQRGVADLTDDRAFPELGPSSEPPSSSVAESSAAVSTFKARKAANKAQKEASGPIQSTAENTLEKQLSVDDIYKVVGKWPAGWPRIAIDESVSRSFYAKLPTQLCA